MFPGIPCLRHSFPQSWNSKCGLLQEFSSCNSGPYTWKASPLSTEFVSLALIFMFLESRIRGCSRTASSRLPNTADWTCHPPLMDRCVDDSDLFPRCCDLGYTVAGPGNMTGCLVLYCPLVRPLASLQYRCRRRQVKEAMRRNRLERFLGIPE